MFFGIEKEGRNIILYSLLLLQKYKFLSIFAFPCKYCYGSITKIEKKNFF